LLQRRVPMDSMRISIGRIYIGFSIDLIHPT
jgi:hypothetical protein